MTNDEILTTVKKYYREIDSDSDLADCIRTLVSQAYEEAAQVADRCAKEADDAAERESLPPDHGGDHEVAARIRALKDSLALELVSP